jgi:hypothetical protein
MTTAMKRQCQYHRISRLMGGDAHCIFFYSGTKTTRQTANSDGASERILLSSFQGETNPRRYRYDISFAALPMHESCAAIQHRLQPRTDSSALPVLSKLIDSEIKLALLGIVEYAASLLLIKVTKPTSIILLHILSQHHFADLLYVGSVHRTETVMPVFER